MCYSFKKLEVNINCGGVLESKIFQKISEPISP